MRIGIVSDIHYAGAEERARGDDFELSCVSRRWQRFLLRFYRHHFWLREPLRKNYLLDRFLARAEPWDYLVANGDYSCDSGYLGVSDPAAFQSARECLEKLRSQFGDRLRANFGDHELGKLSLLGKRGGLRLDSWRRAREELRLEPFWELAIGRYRLLGVVSSLVALPVFAPDMLPEERADWTALRASHLAEIRRAFAALEPGQRAWLFCHDPTALPFLWQEPVVRGKLPQLEQTVIGHLHSPLILWKSRLLSGMPEIPFLGHTAKRLSSALRQARQWRPFKVRLCPSLAGIELLKDGGYLTAELDPEARRPARVELHRLPRK